MAKISRNIKKLRSDRKLTQDALAEKICVTRQTVSSWENDRTQPDIDMLEALSAALEVNIEELIYGEKRHVGLEADKSKYHSTLTVIFAVLGSLLIGAGLVMVFVTGWRSFPVALKTVFAFVPMLVSQAFAIYTVLKKKDSLPFREGAAVLWCAGVIATVALMNSVYELQSGYFTCLIIDGALCLPIMYLLGAVTPLAFCSYAVIHWSVDMMKSFSSESVYAAIYPIISIVLLALVLAFIPAAKKRLDEVRLGYCMWTAVIAVTTLLTIIATRTGEISFPMLAACGILLLALDENGEFFHLFTITGLLLSVVPTVIMSFGISMLRYRVNGILTGDIVAMGFIAVILTAAVIISIKRKIFAENQAKFSVIACAFAASLVSFAGNAVLISVSNVNEAPFLFGMLACSFAMGICLLIFGAKRTSFLYINLGFAVVAAELYAILLEGDLSLLQNGIIFISLGALLLFMNYRMAKKKKKALVLPENTEENGGAQNV